MSDIDELQRRITAALDQVAYGLEKLSQPRAAVPDGATLAALEDERTANSQLHERVRALRDKSERDMATLTSHMEEGTARAAQLDIELQRLRRANDQLTAACQALREANTEGIAEPQLIDQAMLAELEALRAARAADVAEASAILANLQPLLDAAGAVDQQKGFLEMPQISIAIGGRSFDVACQEGEETYLHSAAKMLDEEAAILSEQVGRIPETRMLLMAGLMLADKTASIEDRIAEIEARLAEREAELAGLRNKVTEPERIEVPVVPQSVMDTLAELAARAEALAARVDEAIPD